MKNSLSEIFPPQSTDYAPDRSSSDSNAKTNRWEDIHQTIRSIADSRVPVLLVGKSRSLCKVVARTIHERSARRMQPFVATRCGLFRAAQLERRFFGGSDHHPRAYIRRSQEQPGHVVAAHGGTLYVEQVAHATPVMQDRLLQLLTGRAYFDPFTGEAIESDVRIIATASIPIEAYVGMRLLWPELAQRISIVTIKVPVAGVPPHWFCPSALESRPSEVDRLSPSMQLAT